MSAEETNKKEHKPKSHGSGSMHGMFDMMKCRTGEEASCDCTAMMKNMMGAMTNMPCCGSNPGKTGPEGSEK